MDTETKLNWRENLGKALAETRAAKAEAGKKARAEWLEKLRAEAQELCDRGAEMLRAHGVEVEYTQQLERGTSATFPFEAVCRSGDYEFWLEWTNGILNSINIELRKYTDWELLVATKHIVLDDALNINQQMRIAEMLDELDAAEAELRSRKASEALEAKHEPDPLVSMSTPADADDDDGYDPQPLFRFRAETYNVSERAEELARLANGIAELKVNHDHILYRRLLLTLSDLYAEYARWIAPNTPAKPIVSDEVPF